MSRCIVLMLVVALCRAAKAPARQAHRPIPCSGAHAFRRRRRERFLATLGRTHLTTQRGRTRFVAAPPHLRRLEHQVRRRSGGPPIARYDIACRHGASAVRVADGQWKFGHAAAGPDGRTMAFTTASPGDRVAIPSTARETSLPPSDVAMYPSAGPVSTVSNTTRATPGTWGGPPSLPGTSGAAPYAMAGHGPITRTLTPRPRESNLLRNAPEPLDIPGPESDAAQATVAEKGSPSGNPQDAAGTGGAIRR